MAQRHLEIVDKDRQLAFAPDEFGAVAYDNFLASDGYTWSGIFTNGAERTQRTRHCRGRRFCSADLRRFDRRGGRRRLLSRLR
jgi:hypothetical protein